VSGRRITKRRWSSSWTCLRRNPQFEDGAGRKGLIAIFEMLGNEDPLVTTYRRRMFSLLH
jgi:putative thioredoxin